MEEAVAVQDEVAEVEGSKITSIRKAMQVSIDDPIQAYKSIVSRASPAYIITLHKLLTTMAECAIEQRDMA